MKIDFTAEKLALQIGRCPNFVEVLSGGQNCCKEIVDTQLEEHSESQLLTIGRKGVFHAPEPWAGNLTKAKIMFLSSNPSIDRNEIFPNLTWPESEALDFSLNRFSNDPNRKYGATEGLKIQEFDRVKLVSGKISKRVATWSALRNRAAILLDKDSKETSATADYVMTEVVHCKSKNEAGVSSALSTCVSKWFEPMLALSAAKLIVVSGDKAGVSVKTAISKLSQGQIFLSESWGSWKKEPKAIGKWPRSENQLEEWYASGDWTAKEQFKHIETKQLTLNGMVREFCFVWMPHPTGGKPRKLDDSRLYSPEVLQYLRDYLK